ncbi:hypothetical protein BZA05DRAFT_245637 [Tricharina praecox]|uniref:uncharacterized protein n=1 Tax=Tricharina praecox TaxID=43433 RepID=UPI00222046D5|nr:uncharacterized protein BZA05DRAFT_245637 [Tricharina praecox]KAI5854593.1 hypothetical protein BZA05DRAFT_245637 [Tricharina praecox]
MSPGWLSIHLDVSFLTVYFPVQLSPWRFVFEVLGVQFGSSSFDSGYFIFFPFVRLSLSLSLSLASELGWVPVRVNSFLGGEFDFLVFGFLFLPYLLSVFFIYSLNHPSIHPSIHPYVPAAALLHGLLTWATSFFVIDRPCAFCPECSAVLLPFRFGFAWGGGGGAAAQVGRTYLSFPCLVPP